MLRHLRLEEFVILAEAEIAFGPGLNVVTGETGTGKSILIDAIGLLAGGRADSDWIRAGAGSMMVEATFDVDRLPTAAETATRFGSPPEEGSLHVRRERSRGGRSRAWVQGRSVRLTDLRELGGHLLAIHGQGEHRRLLEPGVQLELVDRFAGAIPLRDSYVAARSAWIEQRSSLEEGRRRLAELLDREEWHRAQIEEIDAAGIAPGEEASLRERSEGAHRILRGLEVRGEAQRLLFEEEGSALDRIETVLHRSAGLEEDWKAFRDELLAARDSLRATHRLLPAEDPLDDEDPGWIEERLTRIARLRKKYGGSEEAILDRRARLAALLEETESLGSRIPRLEAELDRSRTTTAEAAIRLHRARVGVGEPLCRTVMTEMKSLGMGGATLELVLEGEETVGEEGLAIDGGSVRGFSDGIDRGWLSFRPNPGEGAGPLAAVASGGELSRCLLALLTVMGSREEPRTAIFDEVDSGVGGVTARALALRLERLARERQVLLVTHLPVVACRAVRHFRVEKGKRGRRTFATIAALDREERIGELARMLAGEVDSTIARQHAEALLAGATGAKENG